MKIEDKCAFQERKGPRTLDVSSCEEVTERAYISKECLLMTLHTFVLTTQQIAAGWAMDGDGEEPAE
jgi:hypothetical protein